MEFKRKEILNVLHGLVNLHCQYIPADYEHAGMLALNNMANSIEEGGELPTFLQILEAMTTTDNSAMVNYLSQEVAVKNIHFEKLARAYFHERKSARDCRKHGYADLAEHAQFQALGVLTAVEALGYNMEEFTAYYNERRAEWRKEHE